MPAEDHREDAADNGNPAPGLLVLNEKRIGQIDAMLQAVMEQGNGEVRLIVKKGRYRWVVSAVSFEAEW